MTSQRPIGAKRVQLLRPETNRALVCGKPNTADYRIRLPRPSAERECFGDQASLIAPHGTRQAECLPTNGVTAAIHLPPRLGRVVRGATRGG